MRSTVALASFDVTAVVVRTTRVTVARLAALVILGESPVLGQTLVAVATDHVTLAGTLTGHHVAALVVDRTKCVTGTG